MEYLAYFPNGNVRHTIIDPMEVPQWKIRVLAEVLSGESAYRFVLRDPACVGEWDTDRIIGITDRDTGDGTGPIGTRIGRPGPAAYASFDDIPLGSEMNLKLRDDWQYEGGGGIGDTPEVDSPISQNEAVRRQVDTASAMVAAYHALTKIELHCDDDAAAYEQRAMMCERLAQSAGYLGWPLDGNAAPLPECRDED